MIQDSLVIVNRWDIEVVRAGQVIWQDGFYNLVPTAGLNKLLDACFSTGLASPAWYVGLVSSSPTYAATDTMSSHAGWTENANYSAATRPAYVPGTISAGAVSNTASKASFTISAPTTLSGAFMADSSTKSGTSGTLFGVGSFSAGDTSVVAADIVNVTVSITIASGTVSGGFMPIKEQSFGEYHP